MFELPDAKRVRREDLNASDESAWSESDEGGHDAELRAKLNAQIANALGLDQVDFRQPHESPVKRPSGTRSIRGESHSDGAGQGNDEDASHEEFAFRLFSTAKAAPKVVLEDDTEVKGDGGLAGPRRPLEYYVVAKVTGKEKEENEFAAVSGEEVLARSKERSWGLELPWKVTTVTVTRKGSPRQTTTVPQETSGEKGKRPGKKRRISLRRKAKAREEREKAAAQQQLEKEEHIKDKKKRLNRLKKLRRRAKKQATKSTEGGGSEQDDSDNDSVGSA